MYLTAITEETYMDKALTRLHSNREHEHEKEADMEGLTEAGKQHLDQGGEPSNLLVTSTVSVPEVSLVPSPEVSKVCVYFWQSWIVSFLCSVVKLYEI